MALVLVGCARPSITALDESAGADDGGTSAGPVNPSVTAGATTLPGDDGAATTGQADAGDADATGGDADATDFPLPGLPDVADVPIECDLWSEDCPDGEKCMPWANDGGSAWNATRCVPIADAPAHVGQPCMVEGSGVSGVDNCELHAMCWDVDPETLQGTCVGMCTGTPEEPGCADADAVCTLTDDGVLILCIPTCSPLAQDCPVGQACYPYNNEFACVPDGSDGNEPGDPCEFLNMCPNATACVAPDQFESCAGTGCCSPFCSLDDPTPPCLAGQTCLPWYEPGQAPAGSELIGICGVM